jgi:hypothetical protein
MTWTHRWARTLFFPLILAASGCESIALMPRPHIDDVPGSRAERERGIPPDSRRDIPRDERDIRRDSAREEVVGTVERVDAAKNEIQLRTTEARVVTIRYDPSTLVYSRDREVGIEAIRPRDLILARVSRGAAGEQFADVIRLNDRGDVGSRRY